MFVASEVLATVGRKSGLCRLSGPDLPQICQFAGHASWLAMGSIIRLLISEISRGWVSVMAVGDAGEEYFRFPRRRFARQPPVLPSSRPFVALACR